MATEYTDYFDPENTSVGYFKYTLSPESGQAIAPGETVTISGTVRWNRYAIRSVSIFLWNNFQDAWSVTVPVSIAKGTAGKFSIQFAAPDELFDRFTGRTCVTPYGDYGEIISPVLRACVDSDPMGFEEREFAIMSAPLLFLRYRLTPQILALDFERATAEGAWADDGQYLQCKALKLSVNPQAVVDDITTAKIVCTGSDGSSREASLTREQLEAALSPEGYVESKPGIFAGFASALGVDYTLTLTLGDEYDQTSIADTVMRSFARMHLSGAKNGGMAVGMFSSATDDQPKFEVADTHESHFYSEAEMGADGRLHGGTEITGINSYQAGEHATGGYWIDGKPIYRFVQDEVVNVPVSAAAIATLPFVPDTIVHYEMLYYRSSGTVYGHDHNSSGSGYAYNTISAIVGTEVRFGVGSSSDGMSGNHRVIVIVEYTHDIDGDVLRPHGAMGANSSLNCVASSSTAYSSSYPAWHAFNRDLSNSWASTKADANRWLQLKMDVALQNIRLEIYSRTNATPKGPQSGTVLGSNDGSSWTQIGSFSGWDGSQSGALLGTIQCRNATAYSYVRVNFETWQASSDDTVHVGNMKIFGKFAHYIEAAADPGAPEGPEIVDDELPYADPGVARADYIAMMTGIEIPTDAAAVAAPGAQSDPTGVDGPGFEDATAPSAKYATVMLYYEAGVWNAKMVRDAVERWITAEEADEILIETKGV